MLYKFRKLSGHPVYFYFLSEEDAEIIMGHWNFGVKKVFFSVYTCSNFCVYIFRVVEISCEHILSVKDGVLPGDRPEVLTK